MYISRRPNLALRIAVLAVLVALSMLLFRVVLAPAPALALPEGRVYEMVSPPYKGGYDAGLLAAAPNGESAVFASLGVFAHASWAYQGEDFYLAHRGPTGWETTPVSTPPAFEPISDFSANLEYTLTAGSLEATKQGNTEGTIGLEWLLHRADVPYAMGAWSLASWEVAGGHALKLLHEEPYGKGGYEGASGNLCHIFLGRAEGPLVPEAEGTTTQLYDFSVAPAGGCPAKGARSLRLVSVKNTPGPNGEPEPIGGQCLVEAGGTDVGGGTINRFPDGGEEVFFETGLEGRCDEPQLFVRLGGERTVEVSRPLSESCDEAGELPCPGASTRAPARFVGASEDGSKVFFTTAAPLTGGKDEGEGLYMATIGCPQGEPGCEVDKREVTSLVQVSHDPATGEAGEVQGVLRVASDGSRVYFVARRVLSEGANAESLSPRGGADNLYVYDTVSASTAFIGDLCSGPGLSGVVEDGQCPLDLDKAARNDSSLWGFNQDVQSNTCGRSAPGECVGSREPGRYLVFSTYARLVGNDTNDKEDVYRYDAQTGALERVSVGEGGYDANGNGVEPSLGAYNATIPAGGIGVGDGTVPQEHELGARAINEDGSRIVFSTAEPLSPGAVNGLVNVYEWHEGDVSLISSGSSNTGDNYAVISSSGRDVFFDTSAQLVPQDTDEDIDIYDARLEGPGEAFPVAGSEPEPCSGDACQGPLTNPAPLLVPGSVSQASGGDFPAPASVSTVKPKAKLVKCKKGLTKRRDRCVKVRAKAKKAIHPEGSK